MVSNFLFIDPDFGVHIDSFKFQNGLLLILLVSCNTKFLAVPSRAARGETTAYATNRIRSEWRLCFGQIFYAPVMRKIQFAPLRVVHAHALCALESALVKFPVLVE